MSKKASILPKWRRFNLATVFCGDLVRDKVAINASPSITFVTINRTFMQSRAEWLEF